jgi:hypothetical protein
MAAESPAKAPSRGVGQGPPQVLHGDFRRRDAGMAIGAQLGGHLANVQILEALAGVDQDIAIGLEALKDVNLVEQGRVLDDDGVRGHDGSRAERISRVSMRQKGDDRGAGALRTEAGEGLGVLAFARKAAIESISAPVTTPWPPRP